MSRTLRRFVAEVAVLVLLAVGSFGSVETASAAVSVKERFPITAFYLNTCNGEAVVLSGEIFLVTKEKPDGSFDDHLIVHASGMGEQGDGYVLNIQQRTISTTTSFSIGVREVLVSQGSAPNQVVLFTFTFPAGDVTFEIDCRG